MATRDSTSRTRVHELESDEAAKIQWTLVDDEVSRSPCRLERPQQFRSDGIAGANRHGMAEEVFQRAVELFPDDFTSLANLLIARRTLCNWWAYEDTQLLLVDAAQPAIY